MIHELLPPSTSQMAINLYIFETRSLFDSLPPTAPPMSRITYILLDIRIMREPAAVIAGHNHWPMGRGRAHPFVLGRDRRWFLQALIAELSSERWYIAVSDAADGAISRYWR
jgi:hypothetical protein